MPTSVTQKCLQIHNWVKLHLKGVTCKCTQNTPFQVYTAILLPQRKLHPECNASVHKSTPFQVYITILHQYFLLLQQHLLRHLVHLRCKLHFLDKLCSAGHTMWNICLECPSCVFLKWSLKHIFFFVAQVYYAKQTLLVTQEATIAVLIKQCWCSTRYRTGKGFWSRKS